MTFALWWALTTAPGGLWPTLGFSWSTAENNLWLQSAPTRFGGRPQFSANHGPWALKYGSQSAGWGWSLTHKGIGIWRSDHGTIGALGVVRGHLRSKPWTAQATWQPNQWVGRASWNGISVQRSLGGTHSATWHNGSQWVELIQQGPSRSVGFHDGTLDARYTWGPNVRGHLIRLRTSESSLEWRRSQRVHSIQQQLTWSLTLREYRIWLHLSERNGSPQLNMRGWIQTPKAGGWTAGWSSGLAMIRWNAPNRGAFSGTYIELGNPYRVGLSYRGVRVAAEWNALNQRFAASLAARHQWTPKPIPTEVVKEIGAPAWVDLNLELVGNPPELTLEFCGTHSYRLHVLPQSRQWKDHIPPGTYAVRGTPPPGWKWVLPKDSIRLESGKISQLWVRLERPTGYVRWISAPSESGESGSP